MICEVFAIDPSDSGGRSFDFTIATAAPGAVPTSLGFHRIIESGLDRTADADLIAIPDHILDLVDKRYLEVARAAEGRAWV